MWCEQSQSWQQAVHQHYRQQHGQPNKVTPSPHCMMCICAGWADPILAAAFGADSLASHVRLAFAWPNATAPMDIFQKNASQLSHKDDLLIFERNITTGKTAEQDVPEQVAHPTCLSFLISAYWQDHSLRAEGIVQAWQLEL